MFYSDYIEDIVDDSMFEQIYMDIQEELVTNRAPDTEKCTIILGGQPGAGKSTFYRMNEQANNFVVINGDEFRRYHPNYNQIIKTDSEHYAERTQDFSNKVVERLINELGSKGYSLIIEGTLRNPEVPIKTCEYLREHGYHPELVVVACDAEIAWKSTIERAHELKQQGLFPRLVPIDVYDYTVHHIPISLNAIVERDCFAEISIIDREGHTLYKTGDDRNPSDILKEQLNLDNWEKKKPEFEIELLDEKIKLLENAKKKLQSSR